MLLLLFMTQPTTQKRAESSLSMYLTGAAQLQSEGLTLCNTTWTARGLNRSTPNPTLNLMHVPNVGRQDVMHFSHPAQSLPHVTRKAFLLSQTCHLSQMSLYEIVSDKRRVFSLQMFFFLFLFFLMWKTGKDHCTSFWRRGNTSDKILNKLKQNENFTDVSTTRRL